MRVLILGMEPWRSDDSGGNTLNNFFEGMQGVEFAHVYYGNALPVNTVCHKYFRFPELELVRSFFSRKKVGSVLEMTEDPQPEAASGRQNGIVGAIQRLRPSSAILLRNFLVRFGNWKNGCLDGFISDFGPDVIYAPCYASPFQLALIRYVKEFTGKKVVTWSADDSYSLRQFSPDPFFWINRFWTRHCLRETYPYFDEFFSASEDEASEMESVVGKKIGILRKGVRVRDGFTPHIVHNPVRFIYAGGLYLNRDKSLVRVADALRRLNRDGVRAELHIYSASRISSKNYEALNDGRSSFMHGLVSPEELSSLYRESDVAIHCESFDLKYRLLTRLSFSTKIIDCLQSGCAILAIAWKEHTGLKCLLREDAAMCVTDVRKIGDAVSDLVGNPGIIGEYSRKAYECERRKFRIEDVRKTLYDAFERNCY